MAQWKDEIIRLADLARIRISSDEADRLSKQLPEIVRFFEQIKKASSIDEPDNLFSVEQKDLRPDEAKSGPPGLTQADLEKLAVTYDAKANQIVTPAVFEDNNGR